MDVKVAIYIIVTMHAWMLHGALSSPVGFKIKPFMSMQDSYIKYHNNSYVFFLQYMIHGWRGEPVIASIAHIPDAGSHTMPDTAGI